MGRVPEVAGRPVDEPQLARPAQLGERRGREPAGFDLRERGAPGKQRDAHAAFDGALDAVEARERHLDVQGDAALVVRAEHALARGRRVAVRDDRRPAELLERDAALLRERVRRMREDDELVRAEDDGPQALLRPART